MVCHRFSTHPAEKQSFPSEKPSAEKFSFSKTVLCIFFPFRCWEFSLCKHASGVHGSPTRVCYFVIFHVKSMLEETGGSQPRRGSEATKINVWPSLDFICSMALKTVHLLLYLFHFGDEPFRLLGGVQQLK